MRLKLNNETKRQRGIVAKRRWYFGAVLFFFSGCVDLETDAVSFNETDGGTDNLSGGIAYIDDGEHAEAPPCFLAAPGTACMTEWGTPGACLNDAFGYVFCEAQGSCVAEAVGMSCTTEWNDRGVCTAVDGGVAYCRNLRGLDSAVPSGASEIEDAGADDCSDVWGDGEDADAGVSGGAFSEEDAGADI